MAIKFGNEGQVTWSSGGDAQLVAALNAWTCEISATVNQAWEFGDTFVTSGRGIGRWRGTASGHIDSAGAMTATTALPANGSILLRYIDSTTDATIAGAVVIENASFSVEADGQATVSFTFVGNGAYTHTLPV